MKLFHCLILAALMHATRATAEQANHPFACTDYSQGKVFIVSAAGKVEWEYDAKNCNDLWALPNKNLLFNTGHGVREVTRDKKVVWTFADHQTMKTISSVQLLDVPGDTTKGEICH